VQALRLEAADTAALDGIVRAAVAAHRESHAVELLTASTRAHPQVPAIRIAASRLLAAIGAMDQAVAAARQACDIRPIDPAALEQLASLYADVGDAAGLQPVVDELQRRYPDRVATQYYAAASQFLQQQLSDALRLAQQAVATDPTHAAARNLLGAIHASLGHRDEARAAFEAALRLNKRDSATYLNLGLLELSAQNRDRAGAYFAEALSLDPKSAAAREGLAETRR
jgi:Flp pilus assembly protein TadD